MDDWRVCLGVATPLSKVTDIHARAFEALSEAQMSDAGAGACAAQSTRGLESASAMLQMLSHLDET